MPRNESVGPSLVAFGRVVVDHVENHFDARRVQRADHHLELLDGILRRFAAMRSAGPARRSRACCSPSSSSARVRARCRSSRIVMDRQQFDGRDAELRQMVDRRFRREAGVGAAQLFGHSGMQLA